MGKILLNKNTEVLVFDFETENLNLHPKLNRPWEVAYALYRGKTKIIERQRFIWWPDLNVGKDAARITRFNYDLYKEKAEDPKIVFDDLKKFFYESDCVLTGYNIIGFDIFMFRSLAEGAGDWRGYDLFTNRLYDTFCLAKAKALNIPIDEENIFASQLKMPKKYARNIKLSLGEVAKSYNISYDKDQAHAAIYDIGVNYKVFNKLVYDLNL